MKKQKFRGLTISTVKDPMTLSFEKKRDIIKSATSVVCSAFGVEIPETEVRKRILDADYLVLVYEDALVIGLCSLKLILAGSLCILFMPGVVVLPRSQGLGICKIMICKIIKIAKEHLGNNFASQRIYLVCRTQNPNLAASCSHFGQVVAPKGTPCKDLNQIVEQFEQLMQVQFNEHLVIKGIYGQKIYPNPFSNNGFSEYFMRMLDLDSGDAQLVVTLIDRDRLAYRYDSLYEKGKKTRI